MLSFTRQILLSLIVCCATAGTGHAVPADEIYLSIPDGWAIYDSARAYPVLVYNENINANLMIYKAVLEPDETVLSADDLKPSIDRVIEEIVNELPQAALLSNSGYFEENRVRFVLEFNSLDTVENIKIWHRLSGYIYAHPSGNQLLYTLWGRVPDEADKQNQEAIKLLQESFVYVGPMKSAIFADNEGVGSILIYSGVILTLFLAMILMRKNRTRLNNLEVSSDPHFWHCECGRLNHREAAQCRRCGLSQTAPPA